MLSFVLGLMRSSASRHGMFEVNDQPQTGGADQQRIQLVEVEEGGIETLNRVIAEASQPRREKIFQVLAAHYVPEIPEGTSVNWGDGGVLDYLRPKSTNGKLILDEKNIIRYQVYALPPFAVFPEVGGGTPWNLGFYAGEALEKYRLNAIPYLIETLDSEQTSTRMTSLMIIRGILLDPYAPDYRERPEETGKQRIETWKSFLHGDNLLLKVAAAGELRELLELRGIHQAAASPFAAAAGTRVTGQSANVLFQMSTESTTQSAMC